MNITKPNQLLTIFDEKLNHTSTCFQIVKKVQNLAID